jgi:hypothetical protein
VTGELISIEPGDLRRLLECLVRENSDRLSGEATISSSGMLLTSKVFGPDGIFTRDRMPERLPLSAA